ncbi:MAG: cad [Candidatus Saccharibacteria bacterium]|nr:cad [Candidatus Saccharibacteria bacterium]
MSVEQVSEYRWRLSPGPIDAHTHPRVFDAITSDGFVTLNEGSHGPQEGKGGLKHYTEVALRSGITVMLAMPNESVRLYDESAEERTIVLPYPIASIDRVRAMQAAISHEAVIPTGIHMGLDPETAFRDIHKTRLHSGVLEKQFTNVVDECVALKVYLAETTGGYNIALEHATGVSEIWYRSNPEKPIIFHVEGDDVATLLTNMSRLKHGKEIPIHIAHVSSRQELEAVIEAKGAGMNVTCEVTPHHLFMDDSAGTEIGGYGCMKPGLKTKADIDFIWANIDQVDIIASDCAPHRRSDKEAENPAYGVTNHTVLLPLLLGAVAEGKITMEQLYDKLCVKPRQRFNLPLEDNSSVLLSTRAKSYDAPQVQVYEEWSGARYGQNPFLKLKGHAKMVGQVLFAEGGRSSYDAYAGEKFEPSYTHLIRPKNLGFQAVRQALQKKANG